jgi:hypothetical protein
MKEKLTPEFLSFLKQRIVEVFGRKEALRNEHGTVGFYKALQMTCEKFNCTEILKYDESLDWYDSDNFTGDIMESLECLD